MKGRLTKANSLHRRDVWQGSLESFDAARARAVVCANDRIAAELMTAALAEGRKVPQDVRMVGMDDVEYARLLPVPLTTIHQPCREIGMAAVGAMMERRRRPDTVARDILLECTLVERQSS